MVQGITSINHPMHHTFHVTVNFGLEGEAENAFIRIQESEEFPAKKRAKFSLRFKFPPYLMLSANDLILINTKKGPFCM